MGQLSDLHAALEGLSFNGASFLALFNADCMRLDAERHKIIEWISPIDIDQQHRSTGLSLFEGSCAWLLQDPKFTDWIDSDTSAFFWLHGIRE